METYGNYIPLNALYTPSNPAYTVAEPVVRTELYFIYGTLKKGHRNHHLLFPNKFRLVDTVALLPNFTLVEVVGMAGVPAVVSSLYSQVYGELYEMYPENCRMMEAIEQGYTKMPVQVSTVRGRMVAYTWVMLSGGNPLYADQWTLEHERGLTQ